MGKIKDSEAKKYTLTDREFNYAKLLALSLSYNINRDKLISGFLYFIAHTRLGYGEDVNLQFEIDLDSNVHELKITAVPEQH